VPNGKAIGQAFGDTYPDDLPVNTTVAAPVGEADVINAETDTSTHPWGIFLTVLGTVLLDFDADACQSPSRAYLLDVCVPGWLGIDCYPFPFLFFIVVVTAVGRWRWRSPFLGLALGSSPLDSFSDRNCR